MRKFTLALAAATMAVPTAIALPTAPAQAQYRNGNYVGPTWRGRDGRLRCRRSNGTTGLIVGGAAGALVGRTVAGRGNRTIGTVVGGAAGALVGREVQRSRSVRRCR
jgi:hypothetical protein